MPTSPVLLDRTILVNDETNDSQGQLSPGEEALDGDSNAVLTVVRSTALPTAANVRPYGQIWIQTTSQRMFWSRGGGLWYEFRDTTAVPAHQATHRADGADALPWTTIHGSGTLAARPTAAASNAGYLYDATDTQQLFRSTGSAWVELGVSAAAKHFVHTQSAPATGWVVNHNLGRYPSGVAVTDTAGTSILAPWQNISVNQLVVTFGRPATGYCLVG